MKFLSSIPLIGDLIEKIGSSVDELVTSDEERGQIDIEKNKIELKKMLAELQSQHMQLQINMAQANHPSIFVAGARPAIIWIGAVGLGYEAILRPILSWVYLRFVDIKEVMGDAAFEAASADQIAKVMELYSLPSINDSLFMPIVMGVLGVGGMRSWEKIQGKARNNMNHAADEYSELAQIMLEKHKQKQEDLNRASVTNSAMDAYRQASKDSHFKPYFPSEEQILA